MWRLRTIINSEVIIEPGEFVNLNAKFKISKINDNNGPISENLRLCDVFLFNNITDIYEAFALSYNELNCFMDRISLSSYGWSFIHRILSIAPASVRVNEEFEMAIPQYNINRKTVNINLDNLKNDIELGASQQRWVRLLRLGLNASSEEDKYICYYSLLEEIARDESSEFIINICKNCNSQVNTGRKATNNFIKNLLRQYNVESELIDKAEKIRNKIVHGGVDKNKSYFSDVAAINSYMEEVCLSELENRLQIDIMNRLNAHILDIPIVKHKCICSTQKSFDLMNTSQIIHGRLLQLKHPSKDAFQNQSSYFGLALDEQGRPLIHPFSWPNIVE